MRHPARRGRRVDHLIRYRTGGPPPLRARWELSFDAAAGGTGLRTDRIGVWGASAGAYLGSLLGLTAGDDEFGGAVGGNLAMTAAWLRDKLTTVLPAS